MHAPHVDVSQPTFVPVSPSCSRERVDEELARLDVELRSLTVDSESHVSQRGASFVVGGRGTDTTLVPVTRFEDPASVTAALRSESYLADHGLSVAVYLALTMARPLLLEGEPGVGKTEVARTLARVSTRS